MQLLHCRRPWDQAWSVLGKVTLADSNHLPILHVFQHVFPEELFHGLTRHRDEVDPQLVVPRVFHLKEKLNHHFSNLQGLYLSAMTSPVWWKVDQPIPLGLWHVSVPLSLPWDSRFERHEKRDCHWKLKENILLFHPSTCQLSTTFLFSLLGGYIFFNLPFWDNVSVEAFLMFFASSAKFFPNCAFLIHPYTCRFCSYILPRIHIPSSTACPFPSYTLVWPGGP